MNQFKALPKSMKIVLVALVVLLIAAIYAASAFYSKYSALQNPAAATDAEIKAIVAQVGRFIVLPESETPTLATVSDPLKLKEQPFFANSAAGDKVLIYTASRKAILWRPSLGKIIEVSALNIPSTNVPVAPAAK